MIHTHKDIFILKNYTLYHAHTNMEKGSLKALLQALSFRMW